MNPNILHPAMGKQQDRLGSSALVRQLVQEKENSEFRPVKLRLKIDLVSYPALAEGLVNMITKHLGTKQKNASYTANSRRSRKTRKPEGNELKTCRLFYIWDRRNKIKFLVDTGAAISVIPHTIDPSAKPTPLKLQAAIIKFSQVCQNHKRTRHRINSYLKLSFFIH